MPRRFYETWKNDAYKTPPDAVVSPSLHGASVEKQLARVGR
jgi:hypothetical protein